jgi:two-component system sensor histidine kinase KdpD
VEAYIKRRSRVEFALSKIEQKMPFGHKSRTMLRWLLASSTAAAATFLLTALHANSATAGIVFLVLVVWFASREGFALSLFLAALCALGFDFYFLPPSRTLLLVGAQAWIDMLAFAASSVVVSRVAERARRQTLQAQQRRADVERLYALSQEMMLHDDSEALIRELPRLMGRLFELNAVVLYVRDHDCFYSSTGEIPAGIEGSMRSISNGLQPTLALEFGFYTAALMLGLRSVGALAWRPASLSREVAAAVSAQVAVVLARAMAVEAAARLEASRESERLRTALVDSLTHELRTPLTSIRAASTTLLQTNALDAEGQNEMFKVIDEESARLDLLIGEAVQMAEIDAKIIRVRLAPQHPRALMEQAVEESRKPLASHSVSIDCDDSDRTAWFDPHLLGRVLRHLLENAATHTAAGSRIVLASRRVEDRIEFSVEDNGPGIDPVDLPLIFEKFYRGKRGGKKSKGSGMGLAIVRAILAAHGGGIEAISMPGGGARFRLWVPLVEKDPGRPELNESVGESAGWGSGATG